MASKTLDPIDILLELGIDLDDLSEQDYLSALMEAIATIEFQTKGKGDDRSAVLREEVIKIRKGKRKPQAKKTKISANSLKSTPRLAAKTTKISPQKLLPGSAEVGKEEEPEQDSIIKILTDISESVKSILYSLKASNNISKNLAEDERKRRETKKRTGAENKLEKKRFEGLKKLGGKLIQPIKGPLDALFNFLKNVILGRVVIGIIDWLGNEENQKKLQSLIRFFKDWWPTIVTAVLLFGTGLGGLLKSIVGIAFKFIPKLLGLLPGLLKFLASPLGLVAGVGALGVAAVAQNQKGTAVIKDPDDPDKSQMDETREFGGMSGDPFGGLFGGNGGGKVPGKGPNKDTVPAMLSPGEFVMSRGAVNKWGSGMLASMNAAGGGDNRPKMFGGTTYAAGGGMIGGDHKEKMPAEHAKLMAQRDDSVQTSGGVDDRHNQLMQSTSQERISAYDKKHGEGAYSKKLREKLTKIYVVSPQQKNGVMPQSTGMPGMGGGGGGLNALTNQAKSKTFATYIGDTIQQFFGITPKRLRDDDSQRALGEVKESSGVDVPGAAADRQMVYVQPGESILPVDTVNYLGGPAAVDKLIAETDSNSTPAKLGMRSKEIPQVGTPMPMQPQINLIPTPTGGSKGYGDSSGSALPNFDAGTGDSNKAKLLGVVR